MNRPIPGQNFNFGKVYFEPYFLEYSVENVDFVLFKNFPQLSIKYEMYLRAHCSA